MPKIPDPIKKQLGQLAKGSWETIVQQPKEITNTALEQVGVTVPKINDQKKGSVLKPGEKMDPAAIEAKEKGDQARGLQIVKQLNEEIEAARRKRDEAQQQKIQEEAVRAQQKEALANQDSGIPVPTPKPKRGLFGIAGRKKQVTSAMEKSQADKIGQRTSG